MLSHYAPSLPMRLNVDSVSASEVLLAFGPTPCPGAAFVLNLSPSSDLQEAAANLFKMMHEADAKGKELGATGICVMPIPSTGLGLAMNDRLGRAAADRPPEL